MHNLAIALHHKGYKISGSDDQIFEPSRTRLQKYGLLPGREGWFSERVTPDLDCVILGMHAREDNPELSRAKELGLKIYSFPEFIYEKTKNKKRIVIGGSHGKTTITSMIMHVLQFNNLKFDYLVGSQLEGFETMVGIDDQAEIAIIEGDEYLASALDPRPKFHLYHPDVAVVSGIAWDHINVFPTFEKYVEQFRKFVLMIKPGGTFIYFHEDNELQKIYGELKESVLSISYQAHPWINKGGQIFLLSKDHEIPVNFFGKHNMENISAALLACREAGIDDTRFYDAIKSFRGAARRLEEIYNKSCIRVFQDFAHSPSKLKATLEAVRSRFPREKILACMELHTYSSLKPEFLPLYKGTLKSADIPVVFYSAKTADHKKIEIVNPGRIRDSFHEPRLHVVGDKDELEEFLKKQIKPGMVVLLMSSGNFGGFVPGEFFERVFQK